MVRQRYLICGDHRRACRVGHARANNFRLGLYRIILGSGSIHKFRVLCLEALSNSTVNHLLVGSDVYV
jgi:hypothetical protein